MNRKTTVALATLLVSSAFAAPSEAQSFRPREPYASRHTTLPARTLRIDLGPYEAGLNDAGIILGPYEYSAYGLRFLDHDDRTDHEDVDVMFGTGISYGVLDSLEVGALAVPLNFYDGPGQVYGDLTPYVRWAFIDAPGFQMGLNGAVQIPTWTHLGFSFGLPMNINAGRIVRIETGAKLEMIFDDRNRDGDPDDEPRLAVDVPIALMFNIRPRGFLGFRSDLLFDELGGGDDYHAFRPGLGAKGGFTLFGSRSSYFDFTGSFMGYFRDNLIDWEVVLGATVALGL